MEPFDSENYWNRSASKAFSFDDDVDDVDNDFGATGLGHAASALLSDDAISEASFDNSTTASNLNFSINALISEETLNEIILEQTLDDRIIKKGVTPEEELKLLRRQLQTTLYNPSPEATAYKLLLGKNVSLESFRSLHEKKQLIKAVVENGGGDAIITVTLFLKRTLNRKQFHKVLLEEPIVLKHYLSFLKQTDHMEAIEVMQLFNKQHEAALMKFRDAMEIDNIALRKQKLNHLIHHYNTEANKIQTYQDTFNNSLKLLELIDKEHNSLEKVNINSSALELLYECCGKYSNWKEQDIIKSLSPYKLCSEQKISPAQFEWTALNERTKAQAYADLEIILERTSTWNPIKQKQFHISFSLEAAILRLWHLKAPEPVLYIFLSKMNNNTEKLELAQRVKCSKAIIDALAGLKDITQLTQLKDSLPERSEEYFYCDKALKGLQTKRWSTDNIKLKL